MNNIAEKQYLDLISLLNRGVYFRDGKFTIQVVYVSEEYYGTVTYYTLESKYHNDYRKWIEDCKEWVGNNCEDEHITISNLSKTLLERMDKETHDSFVTVLKNIQCSLRAAFDVKDADILAATNITTTNWQGEQQKLKKIFVDAVNEKLTKRQQTELQIIITRYNGSIEAAKPALLKKLASFGSNVLAGVVGNILTNVFVEE